MPALSFEPPSSRVAAPIDPWLGRAAGDHLLLERIGSGGMGVVYEAVRKGDGRRVAVKMLAPELLGSAEARTRLAREARAAASLRSPHAVRILDQGEQDGWPYIVMELCRGEDLAARLAREGRLTADATIAIVGEAASALDEAHAAGIIHRDLKPENVFLAREGERELVKLLDFGVAKLRGAALPEATKTRTGALVGTPHYMSPEQADGRRPIDHRSDLWSLAVIAFRCLTGRLPFDSDALGDLLMQIMSYPLPSPSALDPRLPRALDAWWTRAAARRPGDRFGSAGEMARGLREALAVEGPAASPDLARTVPRPGDRAGGERTVSAEQPPQVLLGRPMPFVGRAREMAALTGMFEECQSGPVAQAALVVGAAGIGKSRLRQELLRDLARRPKPPEVWIARGDAESAGSPFGLIARALRREAQVLDGEPAALQRAKLEARFRPLLPPEGRARALLFLGEMCRVPAPEGAAQELATARESPGILSDHIQRAFEDLVASGSRDRPLVVVLDDVHWGDRPSLDLCDAALRNLPDAPLFVLGLGRPEVTATFPDLWAERRLETLRLGALLPRQCEAVVCAVLGDAVDEGALGELVERSAGNAFFLQELIRNHADGKRDAPPETVLAVLEARIARLDPAARQLLLAGSLFGRVFWAEGARAALAEVVSASAIDAAIETCVRRETLVRHRTSRLAGQTEVAFRHSLVRDAALAMVPDEARAAGHLRAAEWLERAGEHDGGILAEHFERAGRPARAIDAYARAAAQALEGNDFARAVERAERAVRCGASGDVLGALRSLQAEAHGFRDEHEAAMDRGCEAMRLLAPGSAPWCAAAAVAARAAASRSDRAQVRRIAEGVLGLRVDGATPHQVTCAARVASCLLAAEERADGERLVEHAERLAASPGATSAAASAWLRHAFAWRGFSRGDVAENLSQERLAVEAFERAGDERNAAYLQVGLGHAYREVGLLDEAEATLRVALRVAARLGLPNILLGARYTLASVLLGLDRSAEAREHAEAALAGFLAKSGALRIGYARAELARALVACGDLTGAEAEARAACVVLEGAPRRARACARRPRGRAPRRGRSARSAGPRARGDGDPRAERQHPRGRDRGAAGPRRGAPRDLSPRSARRREGGRTEAPRARRPHRSRRAPPELPRADPRERGDPRPRRAGVKGTSRHGATFAVAALA